MKSVANAKVCHVSTVHSLADDRIFEKECVSLAAAGYNVHCIAQGVSSGVVRGVALRGVTTMQRGRLYRMSVGAMSALRMLLALNADLYHLHDAELLFVGLVMKARGKRVIYDAHESTGKQMLNKTYVPRYARRGLAWIVDKVEKCVSLAYDAVVTATPAIGEEFEKGRRGGRVAVVRNYPMTHELYSDAAWATKEKCVCYVGGISRERGIFEMVDAVEEADVTLLLAGTFESAELERAVRSRPGWKNVEYLGQVNRTGVARVLARAMGGLILCHPAAQYVDSLPVKLFEYMSAGIPAVASNFPLWMRIVGENSCGLNVDPLRSTEIARAIRTLVNDAGEAKKMGERGRHAVMVKYNWEHEKKKLLSLYEGILGGGS